MPQLRVHLATKGVELQNDLNDHLQSLFGDTVTLSAPTLFLKPGSTLNKIPTGDRGRHSPSCTYVRAVLIDRSAFSHDLVTQLDKG